MIAQPLGLQSNADSALRICQLTSLQGASVMNARIDSKQPFFTPYVHITREKNIGTERQRDKKVRKRTKENSQQKQTEGQIMTANPKSFLHFVCLSDPQRMKGLEK